MSTIDCFRITPEGTCLESLSPAEIEGLFLESRNSMRTLLNRCALAVLSAGQETDDVRDIIERNRGFQVEVVKTASGVELELINAPAEAFVSYERTGNRRSETVYKMIEGTRQHIFAVLRDLVFIKSEIERTHKFDLTTSAGITDAVFLILRNARVFEKMGHHKIVVCWGGHSISEEEYSYTKEVGYQCGLRIMDIITGCGPGAMKGPMKGATIAHSKQRIKNGRYIGISEPGIIASEPPNPIVDQLIIMPDMEKRLESFLRLSHGLIVFPGGAGTAEELMFTLGVLSHPENKGLPLPMVLTGPPSAAPYFESLDRFVRATLGHGQASRYRIVIDDPERVALEINKGMLQVKLHREKTGDSYYFNRGLVIPYRYQVPFSATHEEVAALKVSKQQDPHLFADVLRRVFSAVVSGNVKPEGIAAVEDKGPFLIHGDPDVLREVDTLLRSFIEQGRMRLTGEYKPCYRIVD